MTTSHGTPETVGFEVDGLEHPVEVLVDVFGVPHISAENRHDVFLAQGFIAARDRLWQMDLWRRQGLGTLAEVFGDEYLDRDRLARSLQYRGELPAEWAAYDPSTEDACRAFVAGINAFVALTRRRPELLPPEFAAIDYLPASWDAADLVRIRSTGVATNAVAEVVRAITLRDFGTEAVDAWSGTFPPVPVRAPDGLDLAAVVPEIARSYLAGIVAPPFRAREPGGSNNWAVAGSRTASGRPIVASDPHRDTTSLPGMRYLTHLACPEFDAIGAGEPFAPGIALGHNGHVAYGFTVLFVDQEDLQVYELDPRDPRRYRYADGWEDMRVVSETVRVRGGADRRVELLFTRHGPVLHHDPARGSAVALRAAWLEPGGTPYLGSLGLLTARDASEFRAALRSWGTPGENFVYADVGGTIGWKQAGLAPRRPNWDGTLPVPGNGRYEWGGFHDPDELPGEENPERGYLATANQYAIPDGHPLAHRLGLDWPPPHRKRRIDEVLETENRATVEAMARLQLDDVSRPAQRLVGDLATLFAGAKVPELMAEVFAWDGAMAAGSRPALVFEVWTARHLMPGLLETVIRADGAPPALAGHLREAGVDLSRVFALLTAENVGSDDRRREIRGIASAAFSAALAEIRVLLGPDPLDWTWGAVHHARPAHRLAERLAGRWPDEWLRTPRLPRGGGTETVMLSRYDAGYRDSVGATLRMVIDVGEWDASVAMNAPGQSGDPRSTHYQDLFGPWASGATFPLLYSRDAVERSCELRIRLTP